MFKLYSTNATSNITDFKTAISVQFHLPSPLSNNSPRKTSPPIPCEMPTILQMKNSQYWSDWGLATKFRYFRRTCGSCLQLLKSLCSSDSRLR